MMCPNHRVDPEHITDAFSFAVEHLQPVTLRPRYGMEPYDRARLDDFRCEFFEVFKPIRIFEIADTSIRQKIVRGRYFEFPFDFQEG
jgi:hypothetical protein